MSENNKRTCPSINSGMLDKLNNFVAPRTGLDLGNLRYQEFEELLKVVDVRRSYTARDLGNPKFNLHNMGADDLPAVPGHQLQDHRSAQHRN